MILPSYSRTALLRMPLLHVTRRGDRHTLHDHSIDLSVSGGDTDVDVLRRAVQGLGVQHGAAGPETLALAIARHVIERTPAAGVNVLVCSRSWARVTIGGRERGGDMTAPSALIRTAEASSSAGVESLTPGLRGLRLLSPGGDDRALLELEVDAEWRYGWTDVPWDTQWQQVQRALTEAYAERDGGHGAALAETLARSVLDVAPAVREMQVTITAAQRAALDDGLFGAADDTVVFGGPGVERAVYEVRLARDVATEIV